MAVAVSAARDHDPRVARADQRVELRAVAVLGDLEERRLGGGRGPQRATLTAGAPARLSTCTASWSSTQSCSCRCGLANASEARWQIASALPVESVTPNRSCASSAIPRREIRCRAVNVTTAACNRGPNAQTPIGSGTGAGSCAAVPTAQLVRAMLGPGHADRRQLSDLVATEPPARRALLLAEPMPASTARVRVMIDDLLDLILGTQLTTGTRCPGCPPDLRRSPWRMNSLAFARASARSCAVISVNPSPCPLNSTVIDPLVVEAIAVTESVELWRDGATIAAHHSDSPSREMKDASAALTAAAAEPVGWMASRCGVSVGRGSEWCFRRSGRSRADARIWGWVV